MNSWLTLNATTGALLLSSGALIVSAWVALRARPRHRHSSLERELKALQVEMVELLDNQEKLLVMTKRKYGRDAVRNHRAKQKTDSDEQGETDEQWKARMNRNYALQGKPNG